MSTEHNGSYCSVRDKMVLTRTQAAGMARRMGGMSTYKCEHCGGWHLTTSGNDGRRYARSRRRAKRRRKS